MQKTLRRNDIPGAVMSIETAGEYLDINPHIHVIATDEIISETGTFYQIPRMNDSAKQCLTLLWEKSVSDYVVKKGYVTHAMAKNILTFRHTGFSVFTERRIDFKRDDEKKSVDEFEHLVRYIVKPTISLAAIEYVPKTAKVVYKGSMHRGKERNFEIFTANDFIAAVAGHFPRRYQKYINYYGVYSNRIRGKSHANKDQKCM